MNRPSVSAISILLIVLFISLFAGDNLYASEKNVDTKIIRNIEIKRDNVFPVINRSPEFFYKLANYFHIITKERTIRNEFLFSPGDSLDFDLIAATERNLRAFSFIGEAVIHVDSVSTDSVDLFVHTRDQWSTLAAMILRSGGGRTEIGGFIKEVNLLGYGKELKVQGVHESDVGTTWTFGYTDPQLLNSRWVVGTTLINGPLIKNLSLALSRPYYSLDTKWAGGISASRQDEIRRLFSGGAEVSRLKYKAQRLQVTLSRALGERFKKRRIELSYKYLDRKFKNIKDQTYTPLPDDELIHALYLAGRLEDFNYIEERRIDKFVRTEDFRFGSLTQVTIGRTGLPINKGVKRFELDVYHSSRFKIGQNQLLFLAAGYETQFYKNTVAMGRLRYYNQMLPAQTLALNLEMRFARELETSEQFLLGGDSGLRGFRAREFNGDKMILVNLEDRLFSGIDILSAELGGVVFFDAGNVWTREQSVDLKDMNYSVGFGLRVGLTRGPGAPVTRIDFGYPLSREGGFGMSIGVGQVFSAR